MNRWVVACAGLAVLSGLALMKYAGIESDEAVFAMPLYAPFDRNFGVTVFHHHVPLMIFYYAGALKALLYWPIFQIFGVNPLSVRIPIICVTGLTVALWFRLAQRLAGARAARLASLLLASDPSFLITNTFDWGPVAVEHLLLVCACVLAVEGRLGAASVLIGLALWNKAVFLWACVGLTLGGFVYHRRLLRVFRDRGQILRCVCGFLIGAMPLIVYNAHRPLATFRSNVHVSMGDMPAKLQSLRYTLDGSILFGTIVDVNSSSDQQPPPTRIGRFSTYIAKSLGGVYHSLFFYGMVLGCFALPFWWPVPKRRAVLFSLFFCTGAFAMISITNSAGAPHHIVLLFHFAQLFVAAAVVSLRPIWLSRTLSGTLVLANLLVLNQYIARLEAEGAQGLFTDAIYQLSADLPDSPSSTIYSVDYGLSENLIALHQGKLSLKFLWVLSIPVNEITAAISDQKGIFISHLRGHEYYQGTADRLDVIASTAGYRRKSLSFVPDSHHRPQFEIFRFEPVAVPLITDTHTPNRQLGRN